MIKVKFKGRKIVVCAREGGVNTTPFLAVLFAKQKMNLAASPSERRSREATNLVFSKCDNWRCFLDEVRTFFDENPNAEF